MKKTHEEITAYLMSVLQSSRYGLTIADIVRKTGISRNTVGKYLTILCTLGQVEMHVVGPAQVYNLSNRIPINKVWLERMPLAYVLISSEGVIRDVNENFFQLFSSPENILIGKKMTESGIDVLQKISEMPDYLLALNGKMGKKTEFDEVEAEGATYIIWTYPVVLYDGSYGVISTLACQNPG
ncbi:PAS domain-containing protein [Methanomicrobium sp. W14]|uniref:hypothetical protein n=1 Tax=Methanomicrobium sp. W14 TaxID=2817839 RepID=UPI001AE6BE28|nr:hypothetical protein [Methanomicrobium sp. W14]MBP2133131.1 PAS domain-containing protein [Methanomicrobium sp. W14]